MRHSCIAIIGAPMDLGAGRRGVDMGPPPYGSPVWMSASRRSGYEVQDLGQRCRGAAGSHADRPKRPAILPQIAQTCKRLGDMV